MSGSGAEKRYQARDVRVANLAAEGLTHREIAAAVGIKPEQVKAAIQRGERIKSLNSITTVRCPDDRAKPTKEKS